MSLSPPPPPVCSSFHSSSYSADRKRKLTTGGAEWPPLRRCCHRQGWSEIGGDLLEYILEKLPLPDLLSCRAVCSSWRSITKTHLNYPPPIPSLPLIIWRKVPDHEESDDDEEEQSESESESDADGCWYFMDVLTSGGGVGGNLYLPNQALKPLLAGMGECVGHSHGGYFMFLDRENDDVYLFHPTLFSGGTLVRFPPISFSKRVSNRVGMIKKSLLWGGDPIAANKGNYGIVVIHDGSSHLLFAKCGATRFTPLECQGKMGRDDMYVDVICTKNNFIYGITDGCYRSNHYIKAWDCSSGTIEDHGVPKMVLSFKPRFSAGCDDPTRTVTNVHLRLVESEGEILLVAIHRPQPRLIKAQGGLDEYNKVKPLCQVYKMDFNKKEWVHLSSLGDRVLFVMEFQSMSLSSHDFPQYQRNSVYFWHYFATVRSKANYLGIFNMEDGSIKLIDAKKKCSNFKQEVLSTIQALQGQLAGWFWLRKVTIQAFKWRFWSVAVVVALALIDGGSILHVHSCLLSSMCQQCIKRLDLSFGYKVACLFIISATVLASQRVLMFTVEHVWHSSFI